MLIDTNALNMFPVNNPAGAVVECANVGNIDTVFVQGRIVKRHGKLVDVDLRALRKMMDKQRDSLFQRAKVPTDGTWPAGPSSRGHRRQRRRDRVKEPVPGSSLVSVLGPSRRKTRGPFFLDPEREAFVQSQDGAIDRRTVGRGQIQRSFGHVGCFGKDPAGWACAMSSNRYSPCIAHRCADARSSASRYCPARWR